MPSGNGFGPTGKPGRDGGTGDDQLVGGGRDDSLFGGAGSDRMWGDNATEADLGGPYHGNDYLDGDATTPFISRICAIRKLNQLQNHRLASAYD
ncbi:hypothetical protein [Thiobacillus sp.]